jgi:hypothetical protein
MLTLELDFPARRQETLEIFSNLLLLRTESNRTTKKFPHLCHTERHKLQIHESSNFTVNRSELLLEELTRVLAAALVINGNIESG